MPKSNILYTSSQIQNRVKQLARQIAQDYKGKTILLIGILNGAYIFMADLQRELYKAGLETDVDFIKTSSYGINTVPGQTDIIHSLTKDVKNRDVLIVEDIIDTGHTLYALKDILTKKHLKSLKIVAFLDKKEKREVNIQVDYVGFTLTGTPWVSGYGLDSSELRRGQPEIVTQT